MKTKIIGLTGGIGSGKSTIAQMFVKAGFPVYIADDAAKKIMHQAETIQEITKIFGDRILKNSEIDRQKLASLVFASESMLKQLNNIIHPLVKKDFQNWLVQNSSHAFVLKESAILFESKTDLDCFKIITVSAPIQVRIDRVMARDKVAKEQVLARIQQQLTDVEREAKSDYIIHNVNLELSEMAVKEVILDISKKIIA